MDNQSGNIIVWDFFNKKEKVFISSPDEDLAIWLFNDSKGYRYSDAKIYAYSNLNMEMRIGITLNKRATNPYCPQTHPKNSYVRAWGTASWWRSFPHINMICIRCLGTALKYKCTQPIYLILISTKAGKLARTN